jgi:dTDP-4-amino-4,6-dideoxygalactose transaminase
MKIPFNRSSLVGQELSFIEGAITMGQVAGDQAFSRKCQELLQSTLGVSRALVTTSCTHALEMSSMLLNLSEGDEVIIPSFTFVSSANAFVRSGATPVFCDVRPDTLNLDETILPSLINERTKAIVPVHYGGVGCEMDRICEIAADQNVAVVEDNAHGLFGKFKGKWLGTFGEFATQSFHETKNITCGEGGSLLINDSRFTERAEIIREKGTNRSNFFRGHVDKYTWVDVGSSYVMSDVLAAFLYGQLEVWESIQAKRKAIWERYDCSLANWADKNGVRRPFVPEHCEQAWHLYYLLLPSEDERDRFIAFLRERGVSAVFHYLPLHSSPMGRKLGGETFDCPVTEGVSARLVRLPFYNGMSPDEQEYVLDRVTEFHVR